MLFEYELDPSIVDTINTIIIIVTKNETSIQSNEINVIVNFIVLVYLSIFMTEWRCCYIACNISEKATP